MEAAIAGAELVHQAPELGDEVRPQVQQLDFCCMGGARQDADEILCPATLVGARLVFVHVPAHETGMKRQIGHRQRKRHQEHQRLDGASTPVRSRICSP